MRRWAALPLLAAAGAACAQPGTPPGGEVDRAPPRVVAVSPAMFDTVPAMDRPVEIRFDERISERLQGVREWRDAILVSPATSPVRARPERRGIEVSLVRGWEPGRVYRVVVLPVFQDLFGNRRVEPVELVFSTGAAIPDAAVAGFVTDRLTGQVVGAARVEALDLSDDLTYVALTDTAGFFALRFLPPGEYRVRSWEDQDRDREPDFFERHDSTAVALGPQDTAVVALAMLRPDSTPARLTGARPIDSTMVRLMFDDHFAPGAVEGRAFVYSLPDSALVGSGTLVHGSRLDSLRAAVAARSEEPQPEDTLQIEAGGETVGEAVDTLGEAVVDTAGAGAAREREGRRGPAREPLPSQELILVAPGLLTADSAYYVRVVDVTNIQGVPGGGGTARFIMPSQPEPGQ